MTTQTHNIVRSTLFVVALGLAGCGKITFQAPPKAPPKQMVQDTLSASLPPFLSLNSIELEPISTGPEAVMVNFKAIVTPKEDLYAVDREVEGTPRVTLLKVVQAAGTKASLYGSVEAHRMMDQWTLESPEIPLGLKQFGAPRGAFDAQSYVSGSNEANAALKQQAANAELQQQARKAAVEQQELEQKALEERRAREAKARQDREEQARIALEEQRKKEMEQRKKEEEQRQEEQAAANQKVIVATVAGTRYIGTMTWQERVQRIRLVFTEQKDFLIRAEVSNADVPTEKRAFTGELHFKPQPEEEGVAYPIVMSGLDSGTWNAFNQPLVLVGISRPSLKLRLTDKGLEGEATGGSTIRLQRD